MRREDSDHPSGNGNGNGGPFFGAAAAPYDNDSDEDTEDEPGFRRGPTSYNSPIAPRSSSRSGPLVPPPLPAGPPPLSPCGGAPAGFSANGIMRRSARAGAGPGDAGGEGEAPPSPTSTAGGFEPAGKVRSRGLGRTVEPASVKYLYVHGMGETLFSLDLSRP